MPASDLLDQRVDYDLVYPNADADLDDLNTGTSGAKIAYRVYRIL